MGYWSQDGWVQLWIVPEHDKEETEMKSILLNGAISSLVFFSTSTGERLQRIQNSNKKLSDLLTRARTATDPDSDCEGFSEIDGPRHLLVTEAVGRAIVFWSVDKNGLQSHEVLPSPPFSDTTSFSSNSFKRSPDMSNLTPICRERSLGSSIVHQSSSSIEPLLEEAITAHTHSAQLGSPAVVTPAKNSLERSGTGSGIPPLSKQNSAGRLSSGGSVCTEDGGLLGTGVLCAHASDVTCDGITELLIGTYGKALVIYSLNEPEDGSHPSFEVAGIRSFPYAVHAINTMEPTNEVTKELQILTAYHLHIVGPDVVQIKERVENRIKLMNDIIKLEKLCREQRIDVEKSQVALEEQEEDEEVEETEEEQDSTKKVDTIHEVMQVPQQDECPTWVVDRFVLGIEPQKSDVT